MENRPSLGRYEPGPAQRVHDATTGDDASAGAGNTGAVPSTGGVLDATLGTASAATTPSGRSSSDATASSGDAALPPGARDPTTATTSCRPGVYTGDFSCTLALASMTASVTFSLQETSQGAPLILANSSFSFEFSGQIFGGDLAGQLDCATDTFHADIVNGAYTPMLPTLIPILIPSWGAVDGQLDRATQSLAGSWWHGPPGAPSCAGTWSAALQP